MLRGLPIVSPLFRKSLFGGGKPPLVSAINRRFRTRTDYILNDEIAGRNATLLAPVSAFNGIDSSVSIPKNIDEHLFPYVDEEYKLYCTSEDAIAKVQGKGNCEKLLMKELGGVLMIDASISREAKFIVSGVLGKVVKYLWGDGNYTKVTHSGLDIVISYTYKTDDVYYFLWDSDEFNKLQITSSKDALEGNISSLANLTYIASFSYCNKLTVNSDFTFNVTQAYFSGCDFSTIEIERLVRALDNNNKNNGILAITGINTVPNADTLLLITSLKSKGWTVTHN